jgi:hypothetical protein
MTNSDTRDLPLILSKGAWNRLEQDCGERKTSLA